jgi:iron complex outermembrane recepter protein
VKNPLFALATTCLALAAPAAAETATEGSLMEEPLESLLQMEITSVSKRPQRISQTAAAIFVITAEDIRRSGHANVPELLRVVPGANVGQATPKSWNIGVRGDESSFSRMLLVLLDGRAVYNSSFNGTFWELLDLPLEDIDRIEVIRGPGAAVWGANALHGVINIIRKRPEDTRSFLSVSHGNEDRLVTSLGYSGELPKLRYRLSSHLVNRDAFRARDDSVDQHDDYRHGTAGGRTDVQLSENDTLTLQGDYYSGDRSVQARRDLDPTGLPAGILRSFETYSVLGGNAMARYEHRHSENATTELQLYMDYAFRDILVVTDSRTHYDFELRNRFKLGERQLVNWGAGTRHVQERVGNTLNFTAAPKQQDEAIYSFHVQDELAAIPNVLTFTLGTKVEWNTFTGWEVQPTARALWQPAEYHQLWAAVSRGVRTPARFDIGEYTVTAAYVLGTPVEISGNEDFDSEVLIATDLGYRWQAAPNLHLDLTGYTHRTQNFGIFRQVGLSQVLVDSAERSAIGGEVSVRWQPLDYWRLAFGWSHINIEHSGDGYGPAGTRSAAPHQWSLISYLDLPGNLELDMAFYYHGRYGKRVNAFIGDEFNSYTRYDVRVGWRPTEHLELAIVGQNLLDRLHREGIDYFEGAQIVTGLPQSSVQRSIFGRATWRF